MFLWFGLHLNQFSSPVVNKFIKAEKKQTLGDIVVLADHTNNHDNCTVAIKASKSMFPFFFFPPPGFALAVAIVAICEDFYFLAPKI